MKKEIKEWQRAALEEVGKAVAEGTSRVEAAERVVEKYGDQITAVNKNRAVRRFFMENRNTAEAKAMVAKAKNSSWKTLTVRLVNTTPLKRGHTDWKGISEEVKRIMPEMADTCNNLSEKLRNWFRHSADEVDEINRAIQAENIVAHTVTTAHLNDDDVEEPIDEEVVPAPRIIKVDMDSKTQQVSAELELLIGPGEEGKLKDSDFIIRTLGYDPENFELISASIREGTWGIQKKGGALGMLSSKRVMANIRPRKDSVHAESFAREFMEHIKADGYKPRKCKKRVVKGDNVAIVTIADLHLGKLAWKLEAGENYDHKIAKKRFFYIIDSAIDRIKAVNNMGNPIEKIIFFWSQDFFHFDTTDATTTAGTRQDTDVRWQKLFYMGCQILAEAVKELSLIAPVETFYTRSNHDEKNGFNAILYLDAFFMGDDNVKIDTSPIGRKYIQYGINLFGFGHGDKEGKRISSLMAIEAPKQWGDTTSREFFLGHFHKRHTVEDDEGGVVLRYLASPTSTDAWHYTSGFIGAQKQAQVFIRNKQTGPFAEFPIPIPYDPEE